MQGELSLGAAIRDIAAGLVLLVMGLVTRSSSFDGLPSDAIDHVFDALACFWILWGVRRIVMLRAAGRPPS